MFISIIIPLRDEEENLIELYRRLSKILEDKANIYEIIFVDDGSIDNSCEILKDIHNQDKRVKIVKLRRNFGQIPAILAGIKIAQGDTVITLDADLQNLPEEIPKFIEKIKQGYSVVLGYRIKRKDYFLRKFGSSLAWKLISLKSGIDLKDLGCGLNAIKKNLVDRVIKTYGENIKNIKPLLIKEADLFCEIEIGHSPRSRGKSKYSFFRLIVYSFGFLKESCLGIKKKYPIYEIEEILQ